MIRLAAHEFTNPIGLISYMKVPMSSSNRDFLSMAVPTSWQILPHSCLIEIIFLLSYSEIEIQSLNIMHMLDMYAKHFYFAYLPYMAAVSKLSAI